MWPSISMTKWSPCIASIMLSLVLWDCYWFAGKDLERDMMGILLLQALLKCLEGGIMTPLVLRLEVCPCYCSSFSISFKQLMVLFRWWIFCFGRSTLRKITQQYFCHSLYKSISFEFTATIHLCILLDGNVMLTEWKYAYIAFLPALARYHVIQF